MSNRIRDESMRLAGKNAGEAGSFRPPKEKPPGLHRAWLILLGCCFMQGGSMGIIMNTVGLFFNAVSTDLGFAVGDISLYRTISGLSSCLLLPFVGKILYKADTRVTLSLSVVTMAVCAAGMGFFSELWQWYAAAFVQGIAAAMLLTASEPIILANWFHEKLGLAIGISAAFSGLMGTAGNLVFERVIALYGWRVCYIVSAAAALAMMLPMTLFVVRLKPEMKGCTPYGQKSDAPVSSFLGVCLTSCERRSVIGMIVLAVCSMQFSTGFSPQIASFAVSIGKTLAVGAALVSWSMVTNALGKAVLGQVNDAAGLKAACITGFAFAVPGYLMLLGGNDVVMTFGSACYGAAMSLAVITPPLITRKFFSDIEYPRVFSFVMMVSTLLSSFAPAVFGMMYDAQGSYTGVIVVCIALSFVFLAMCAGLYFVLKRARRRGVPAA